MTSLAITHFNETKPYTLLATKAIQHIMTDRRLIGKSAQLWKYLYTFASQKKALSLTISVQNLAEKFNYSSRTIQRYLQCLKTLGYLNLKHNFNRNGQQANTIFIEVPGKLLEVLENSPDRNKAIPTKKIFKEEGEIIKQPTPDEKNNMNEYDAIKLKLTSLYQEVINSKNKIPLYDEINKLNARLSMINIDNNGAPRDDKNVAQNITTLKEITKRQSIVDINNVNKKTQTNTSLLARRISSGQLSFLALRLKKLGFFGKSLDNLQEEVIFSIEQGSLCKDKEGQPLPILKALNIALKPIKINRWHTPSPLRNKNQV